MLELVLFCAIGMLAYIYVGYPLLAIALGYVFRREVIRGDALPTVTLIISAYNEEKHIRAKVLNTLALAYPSDKVQIIVASDASDDRTDSIVQDLAHPRVQLLRVEGRLGKTACQNAAATVATGEILVFADATTMLEENALAELVRSFADNAVGCVAGNLVYTPDPANATNSGRVSYWTYEVALRMAESALGSLIGVSGQLYAVRASAYRPIAPDTISDFVIALDIRDQNLRTVLEPKAICYEETLVRGDDELSMRIRVTLRSLLAIARWRHLLNPLRFGIFAWQLLSHKVLRYLSPAFWLVALMANIALAVDGRYVPLLVLQLVGVLTGALGFLPISTPGGIRLLAQPYYFLLTNLSSAIGLIRFMKGQKVITWTPVR
ncbi:glycosyltransferase family 2 protein [Aerolutibacter ruishenii]|uniref:Cellulose synthase/poly-beta-1,6-N-acetylglucosamine synthase-like glycosyltransferase n=1 Tax=Aerolutibacter ruishenii TaxID=686800 RepID=A0A562LXV2_9GAMM|nr:glycosyltransferase family 2 protein [Lysobacter ruishenii]TWI12474.1 cellulose synthase/poly-beta-1,6-N-acetylglucosamine synthase-like glycosyltransferase [Lysobacter ruishenii]